MKKRLFDILDKQKIFKLVLGLGNQSLEEIEYACEIYAKAGADMFDLNASEAAIEAAFRGIKNAGLNPKDFLFSISAGIEGDTHTDKAFIDNQKCVKCGKCIKVCPQNAIILKDGVPFVQNEKCIGCKKCKIACKYKAISFKSTKSDLEKSVSLVKKYDIDCLELHVSSKKPPLKEIKYLSESSDCPLSLCLDRKYYSNEKVFKLISKVKKFIPKFIIQADGVPMTGGDDSFESTLQAVAMAHLINLMNDFDGYILISGGTNSKTAPLADMCNIKYHGISVGSYARKIIKNVSVNDAVHNAEVLVKACKA